MDIPQKCISFSPNWFYPQIAQMNDQILCYGVNEQVFVYHSQNKNFRYILQGQYKITMLYLQDSIIFVGQENGIISIFEQQQYKGKLEFNIQTPLLLTKINNQYILYDNQGIGISFQLNQDYELIQFTLKLITQPHCIPKFGNDQIVMYQSGRIYRYQDKLEYDYPYHILCVDKYNEYYAILNKLHKVINLHIFKLQQLDQMKQNNNISDDEIFIELKFIINDKLPMDNLKKSPLTIKFYNQNQIFITSKQGEIFLINLSKNIKQIKLDANIIQDKNFYKLPQEIHIKGIYLMNNYNDYFYTVGLDRRIFSFKYEDEQILDCHKFVCLAGKVNKLQIGREKNLIYYHDQTLKSMDLSKINYPIYINEFWKINDFNNFYISPFQEGITIIQKEQKLELIDIYKEQIIQKYQCEDSITKIIWLNTKQVKLLLELFEIEYQDVENNINDFILILMFTGRLKLIRLNDGQILLNQFIQQLINVQKLITNKIFDLFTIQMNSFQIIFHIDKCQIFFIFNDYYIFYYSKNNNDCKQIHNQDILTLDVSIYQDNIYLLTGCINQTISINIIKNEIILLGYLKHKYPIQKVQQNNGLITALAKCHQSLQIWDVKQILQRNIPSRQTLEGLEKTNIRGHSGFILDFVYFTNNIVLTSSEDQTIKVFDIDQCQNKQPPNKKKNKKKVKN